MKNISHITAVRITEFDPANQPADNALGEINFNSIPGKSLLLDLPLTSGSGSFVEEKLKNRAGPAYTKDVTLRVPRIYFSLEQALERFHSKAVTAMVTDANATTYLVFPLMLEYKKAVPGTIGSYRGYSLNLSGIGIKPAFFVKNIPSDVTFITLDESEGVLAD